MRDINEIILHCTASDADPSWRDIDRWHRERGWNGIGYAYLIRSDGTIEKGRELWRVGAHCYGRNKNSIGIALNGLSVFNDCQFTAAARLIYDLKKIFGALLISPHNKYNPAKDCPVFDIKRIREELNELETTSATRMERRYQSRTKRIRKKN